MESMSHLRNLSIQGIRSFSPEDDQKQILKFETPLTIIVGHNGSGKTTIIECLRYLCTGEMPPGSKNACFVHEPKLTRNKVSVTGKVKLQFIDSKGEKLVATRALTATQKASKIEVRSGDATIKRENPLNPKQPITVSSKCAEMDREMSNLLGVSKAVLTNVIFCHQEDSTWPLSEAKSLKMKFDEIFSATKYTKVLDSIRKLRTEQTQEIRVFGVDLNYLKDQKRKASELRSQLDEELTKLNANLATVNELEAQMKPINDKIKIAKEREQEIQDMSNKIDGYKMKKEHIEQAMKDLEPKLGELFDGDDNALGIHLREFQSHVEAKITDQRQLKIELDGLEKDRFKKQDEHKKLLVQKGGLDAAVNNLRELEQKFSQFAVALASQLKLTGYPSGPDTWSEQDVERFRRAACDKLATLVRKRDKLSEDMKSTAAVLEKEQGDFQSKKSTISGKKTMLEGSIKKYHDDARMKREQLARVEASSSRMEQLEKEIEDEKEKKERSQSNTDLTQSKKDADNLERDTKRLDFEHEHLLSEYKKAQEDGKYRTEYCLHLKSKAQKEEKRRNLLDLHSSTLKSIFGQCVPTDNLQLKVSEYQRDQRLAQETVHAEMQKLVKELTLKEVQLEQTKQLLKDMCMQVQQLQDRRAELEVDADCSVTEALKQLDLSTKEMEKERSSAYGSNYLFRNYKKQLTVPKYQQAQCPVCLRGFAKQKELEDAINNLTQMMEKLPDLLNKYDDDLKRSQKKERALVKLEEEEKGVKQSKTDVPALETKLAQLEKEIKLLKARREELTSNQDMHQHNLDATQAVLGDAGTLDTLQKEIADLSRRVRKLEDDFTPGVRSPEEIVQEMELTKQKLDASKKQLEAKRTAVKNQEDREIKTEKRIQTLCAELLDMKMKVQEQDSVRNALKNLDSQVHAAELELEKLLAELAPIDEQLSDVLRRRAMHEKESNASLQAASLELENMQTSVQKLKSLADDLKTKHSTHVDDQLTTLTSRFDALDTALRECDSKRAELLKKSESVQQEVQKQALVKINLENQQDYRKKSKEVKELDVQIATLKKESGGLDSRTLLDTRRKLDRQYQELFSEQSMAKGRQSELQVSVRRLKKELETEYQDTDEKYREKLIQHKTMELANSDLQKYAKALDTAILKFHKLKMDEINKILQELWQKVYRGNDIDFIAIRSDEDENGQATGATGGDRRRVYNYRVVMVCEGREMDMRGRCSAGQKVLASLIIRIALAETFCSSCGILALDEPTTNLDHENMVSLAKTLCEIVEERAAQKNFQLLVITHDEEFVQHLLHGEGAESYLRVNKDEQGNSRIKTMNISTLRA